MTIHYLDRDVLGLLKNALAAVGVFDVLPGDREMNYSTVVICFQIAYPLGMLLSERIIDKTGTRKGDAYALIGWSVAAIGHHTWSFSMCGGTAEAGILVLLL